VGRPHFLREAVRSFAAPCAVRADKAPATKRASVFPRPRLPRKAEPAPLAGLDCKVNAVQRQRTPRCFQHALSWLLHNRCATRCTRGAWGNGALATGFLVPHGAPRTACSVWRETRRAHHWKRVYDAGCKCGSRASPQGPTPGDSRVSRRLTSRDVSRPRGRGLRGGGYGCGPRGCGHARGGDGHALR
jgi:hypothetical protein